MPRITRENLFGIAWMVSCALIAAFLAVVTWSYIAGGEVTALKMRVGRNETDIAEVKNTIEEYRRDQKQVEKFMREIDKRLEGLSARQEVLHSPHRR